MNTTEEKAEIILYAKCAFLDLKSELASQNQWACVFVPDLFNEAYADEEWALGSVCFYGRLKLCRTIGTSRRGRAVFSGDDDQERFVTSPRPFAYNVTVAISSVAPVSPSTSGDVFVQRAKAFIDEIIEAIRNDFATCTGDRTKLTPKQCKEKVAGLIQAQECMRTEQADRRDPNTWLPRPSLPVTSAAVEQTIMLLRPHAYPLFAYADSISFAGRRAGVSEISIPLPERLRLPGGEKLPSALSGTSLVIAVDDGRSHRVRISIRDPELFSAFPKLSPARRGFIPASATPFVPRAAPIAFIHDLICNFLENNFEGILSQLGMDTSDLRRPDDDHRVSAFPRPQDFAASLSAATTGDQPIAALGPANDAILESLRAMEAAARAEAAACRPDSTAADSSSVTLPPEEVRDEEFLSACGVTWEGYEKDGRLTVLFRLPAFDLKEEDPDRWWGDPVPIAFDGITLSIQAPPHSPGTLSCTVAADSEHVLAQPRMSPGRIHPHVDLGGHVCFGDIPANSAAHKGHVFTYACLAYSALTTGYNGPGAFSHLFAWARAIPDDVDLCNLCRAMHEHGDDPDSCPYYCPDCDAHIYPGRGSSSEFCPDCDSPFGSRTE